MAVSVAQARMETPEQARTCAPSPEVGTTGAAPLKGGEPSQAITASDERRNHRLHVLEGAALMGAFGAINGSTVGTSLVASLGGNAWLVAFVPMASTLGFALGPILSAHRLDGQRQFLPVLA